MCWSHCDTHQAQKDTEELNHICVGNRVESSHEGVEDGYHGRDHHRDVDVYIDDHTQSGACGPTQSDQSIQSGREGTEK